LAAAISPAGTNMNARLDALAFAATVVMSLDEPDAVNLVSPELDPGDIDRLAVRLALESLPLRSQDILRFIVCAEYSQVDLAEHFHVSQVTIGNVFRKAKNALRRALVAQGVGA
jgi:DNA-directed RNA polymerase specialized sigma24 family protein